MNSIENLWSIVKRTYDNPPFGVHELWKGTQQEWYNIGPEIIKNLIDTVPLRLQAIEKNKGEWTKY